LLWRIALISRFDSAAADALALSEVVDLQEIGLPLAAAATIAGYFGKVVASSAEPESKPESEPEPEAEPELEEPQPQPPPGPMAEFDEAAVLAWVAAVPGLTAAQRAAALERVAEEEYDGDELAAVKPKRLLKLLKGREAEGAVSALVAARDAQLKAEEEAAPHLEPAAAEWPSCAICMEPYSAAAGVVPRMLVACGHSFCEACLDRMLRCAGTNHASPLV
jgi:hypothetical protein